MKKLFSICCMVLFFSNACCFSAKYVNVDYIKPNKEYLQYAVRLTFLSKENKKQYGASGFAADKDTILTAGHFCKNFIKATLKKDREANKFKVQIDYLKNNTIVNKEGTSVLNLDNEYDLCLLSYPDHGIPFLSIDTTTELVPGDELITIGSPSGVFPVLTSGMVVEMNESVYGTGKYGYVTSIPVSSGNSGGVVIHNNKIVGMINRVLAAYDTISFATKPEYIYKFLYGEDKEVPKENGR